MTKQINISQTDLINFSALNGLTKISKVKSIYSRNDYHPAQDFYKSLREELIDYVKLKKSKKELFDFLDNLPDSKKYPKFLPLIKGYFSLIGRKKPLWFKPPQKIWTYKSLDVRVNPELGFDINGERFIIKLYFKEEPLGKKNALLHLRLMQKVLCTGIYTGYKCLILDLRNRKQYQLGTDLDLSIDALLEGEAESFLKIWLSFERRSA